MTDSIEIVEQADGVQIDLLAEALGKGKVAEPGAAAEYTEVGAVAADTAEIGGRSHARLSRPQRRH